MRIWSDEDCRLLIWAWGSTDIGRIAKRFGRSEDAIRLKAHRLGLPSPGTGYYTLKDASRILGYDPKTILDLAKRLKLLLHRRARCTARRTRKYLRPYAITLEQLDVMSEEVSRLGGVLVINRTLNITPCGMWGGKKPDSCLVCGDSTRPHQARGLCKRCYMRAKRGRMLDKWPPINGWHYRM